MGGCGRSRAGPSVRSKVTDPGRVATQSLYRGYLREVLASVFMVWSLEYWSKVAR